MATTLRKLTTWGDIKAGLPTNKRERVAALEDLILYHRDLYYGSGDTKLTDNDYDLVEQELHRLDPKNKILNTTGMQTRKLSKKVKIPFPMPSLQKVRPQDGNVSTWLKKFKGPYIVSDKLDGVSLELVYKQDEATFGVTRGRDEKFGQDVSHLIPYMDVPDDLDTDINVRGEVLMPEATFQAKWKGRRDEGKYKNSRNMMSGLVNGDKVHRAVKDVHVIAYSTYGKKIKPSQQLSQLKRLGFHVVPYKVYNTLTEAKLQEILRQRKAKSKYNIDGIVIAQDTYEQPTWSVPSNAVAFKDLLEDNVATTTVTGVTWQASRYGKLTPVVNIEPVELSGVTVTNITGNNAKYIVDNKIGKGAVITLTRSGEVIPHILSVVKPARQAAMPDEDCDWSESGVDLILTNKQEDYDTKARSLAFFFTTLGVANFQGGTAAKLVNAGYDTVASILKMKPRDFAELPGFAAGSAGKLFTGINTVMRSVALSDLMYASGVFGRGIGMSVLQPLWEAYGTDGLLDVLKLPPNACFEELSSLTPVARKTIAAKARDFIVFFKGVSKYISMAEYEEEVVVQKSTKLKGVVVCVTGFRDDAFGTLIEENGGSYSESFSSKTTVVVCKDPTSSSGKIKSAQAKGLPVLTKAGFLSKYRLSA